MNSQLNQKTIAYKSDASAENEPTGILNSTSRLETPRTNKISNAADDLIASLQNHRENRRARQVFEWETARRKSPVHLQGRA